MGPITEIILLDVIVDEPATRFTVDEFYEHYRVSQEFLQALLEYSLLETANVKAQVLSLDLRAFQRIQSARRLQEDLEVNLQGIALILELVDELKETKRELDLLNKST